MGPECRGWGGRQSTVPSQNAGWQRIGSPRAGPVPPPLAPALWKGTRGCWERTGGSWRPCAQDTPDTRDATFLQWVSPRSLRLRAAAAHARRSLCRHSCKEERDLSPGGTQEQSCGHCPGRPGALPSSPSCGPPLRVCAARAGVGRPRPPARRTKGSFLAPGPWPGAERHWAAGGGAEPGQSCAVGAALLAGLPQVPQAPTSPFSARAMASLPPRAMGRGPLRVGHPAAPGPTLHLDICFSAARRILSPGRVGAGECWQSSLCPTSFVPGTHRGPPPTEAQPSPPGPRVLRGRVAGDPVGMALTCPLSPAPGPHEHAISSEDMTVHFTSTLMALIRTALEIKLAPGELGGLGGRVLAFAGSHAQHGPRGGA